MGTTRIRNGIVAPSDVGQRADAVTDRAQAAAGGVFDGRAQVLAEREVT